MYAAANKYSVVQFNNYPKHSKTPQELKIEELENSIAVAMNTISKAQKQLQELKGM